jgi:hypothetical protein
MTKHSLFSPSAAHRWMRCPGSLLLESREPASSSAYAEEGTKAHDLAAAILGGLDVRDGDPEMLMHVNTYVDTVRKLVGEYGEVHIERRVDFSDAIGEPDAFGTSDCLIVNDRTLTVVDFKYGMGVRVDAKDNEQMLLYALGAMYSLKLWDQIAQIQLVIVQPRIGNISSWMIDIADLEDVETLARKGAAAAARVLEAGEARDSELNPGDKQCRFCRAKASCPALAEHVYRSVVEGFEDLDTSSARSNARVVTSLTSQDVGRLMGEVDLIEGWCASIRERVYRDLEAGVDVPGWKLVVGRKGQRKWDSDVVVEDKLRHFGLNEYAIYEKSLISPAGAEKLVKAGVLTKDQYIELQASMKQAGGKATIAPVTDKRPAISQADLFAN